MIKVGEYQTLKINREMPQGFYLTDGSLRQPEEEEEEYDGIEYDSQGNEIRNPFEDYGDDESSAELSVADPEESPSQESDSSSELGEEGMDESEEENEIDAEPLLNEVLLPGSSITPDMKVGDEIEVFVYCDSEDRDVATTDKPFLTVNQFAFLKVNSVTNIGAFCDWGMPKDLLIPFSNQAYRMKENRYYVVHMYLDQYSDRLVGTTKLNQFLVNAADDEIKKGQKVDLLVEKETDIGYKVIINQRYGGLLYRNEVPRELEPGDELIGYIKAPREDGKIDVSINAIGYESVSKNEQSVLDKLEKNEGFLPYHDKSDPDSIRDEFGMSKKLFKKVLGSLYKQRRITIESGGIRIATND